MTESNNKPPQDLLDWLGINNAPNWRVSRPLGWILGAVLVAGVLLSLLAVFVILIQVINGEMMKSPSGSLGAGALIVAVLSAPFLVWNTVIKHEGLRYQKEGQMTDRIAKAVEQLGAEKAVERIGRPVVLQSGHRDHVDDPNDISFRTVIEWQGQQLQRQENEFIAPDGEGLWQVFKETQPNLEVRMGAILSLERIAQDSTTHDKGRDHVMVMEILCAYIRNNAPASFDQNCPVPRGWSETLVDAKAKAATSEVIGWVVSLEAPRPDIQLALTVLGRRTLEQIRVERLHVVSGIVGFRLDLSRSNLQCAKLGYSNFEYANFSNSNLDAAQLSHSKMANANFSRASIIGARCQKTDFSHAELDRTDLSFSYCDEAIFIDPILCFTHFVGASLRGSKFVFPRNHDRRSYWVNRAFLQGADLVRGDFSGGVSDGIHLSVTLGPDGNYYQIDKSSFRECEIENTGFAPVLPSVFGDGSVILPEGVERPAHWPKTALDSQAFQTELAKWRASPTSYTPPD